MKITRLNPNLAGSTKNKGIFNPAFDWRLNKQKSMNPDLIDTSYKKEWLNYQIDLRIPVYFMPKAVYDKAKIIYPHMTTTIGTVKNATIMVSMPVHAVEISRGKNSLDNAQANIIYEPTVWIKIKTNTYVHYQKPIRDGQSYVIKAYTNNPKDWFRKNIPAEFATPDLLEKAEDWLFHYSLKDQLENQTSLLCDHLPDLLKEYARIKGYTETILKNASQYKIDYDVYKTVFYQLKKQLIDKRNFDPAIYSNQYLLLMANLEQLHLKESVLPHISGDIPLKGNYNPQQRLAVRSPFSMSLLQSVAGSGKSHTVLGRIKYLLKSGVKPEEITVLSFTNAAADHITAKLGNKINSMTIAKMVHDIYQHNLKHILSNADTLINSLRLTYAGENMIINDFIKLLIIMKQNNNQHAQTDMLYFINENYSLIVNALNRVNQTTLGLEEILSYLNADHWNDPFKTKYLIVDEVQDTSIFQFIYLLHYAATKNISLFFVGDASQTLYAFRNADPNALNALEKTNYFHIFKLETNYRSKAPILMFANKMLDTIQANEYAKLKLKPCPENSKLDQNEFLNRVEYVNSGISYAKDINANRLLVVYQGELKQFLTDALENHKQVAFLGYTKKTAEATINVLKYMFPRAKIAVLTPLNRGEISLLSDYLYHYGREMEFIDIDNFEKMFEQALIGKSDVLQDGNLSILDIKNIVKQLMDNINDFWVKERNKYKQGVITHKTLIERITREILDFEIAYNQQAQTYFDTDTEEQAKAMKDANFVVSTIHSTKGLEFDECVVMLTNTTHMTQEQRRLYYVSLTRAKEKELLLEVTNGEQVIYDLWNECVMSLGTRKEGNKNDRQQLNNTRSNQSS